MDLYAAIVFVHVLAASVLLGTSLVFPLTRRTLRSVRTVAELRAWLAFARSSSSANPACALVLLATGLYLGSNGWWTTAWFGVAVGLFVVNGFYAARAVEGASAALGAATAEAGDGPVPQPVEALRWSSRLDLPADLLLANDVSALFIMIVKPGLLGCAVAVAVANGALLALRRRRRAGRADTPAVAVAPAAKRPSAAVG